ncbi:MAG TPA: hypothetical protein PKM59_07250 [Thermodesulfobacteriota bacterium]|nr:hypothetical protein [Thermodesulfobacteriota bacterium]HNU70380.1 hypothetical protein [Thermodesulfobacteriota bacterium]
MKQMAVSAAWGYLQSRKYQDLHIADIWLTSSDSLIGDTILLFQGLQGDPAEYHHTSGYSGSGNILEALKYVTERSGACYFRSCHTLKVIRNITWDEAVRADILFHAKKYQGWPYAYGKVVILQALDCIFRTDCFTRHFTVTPLPYCSQLWAKACQQAGALAMVNGKRPDSVNPDDWDDHSKIWPRQWRTVLEHDGRICKIYSPEEMNA